MTLPLGYTRPPDERRRFIVESIEGIEEGLATPAAEIEYPNAGKIVTCTRAEAIARLRLFLSNLAEIDRDAYLASKVNPAATLIRVVSARGYRPYGRGIW